MIKQFFQHYVSHNLYKIWIGVKTFGIKIRKVTNYVAKALSKAKSSIYLEGFDFNSKKFSEIINWSSHLQTIMFQKWKVLFEGFKFRGSAQFQLRQIYLPSYNLDDPYWGLNEKELENLLKGISSSSLKNSLRTLDISASQLSENQIVVILEK